MSSPARRTSVRHHMLCILSAGALCAAADIAAINHKKTGVLKNASYASVFSFSTKAAGSIGILICGRLLQTAGIISGAKEQTSEAVRNISIWKNWKEKDDV